jgi:hypothetical protein
MDRGRPEIVGLILLAILSHDMNETAVEALVDAAVDGVDCDGLRADRTDAGFRFETPTTARTGLSAAQFRSVAADHEAHVTNWYVWSHRAPRDDAERAFLRWIERADERSVPERYDALRTGDTREWGQLLVTVERDAHGRRRYELRHADDADADRSALTTYDDPLEARAIAKRDAKGRYRPLKTAPTLQRGWLFPDLTDEELVAAVECFYPATLANWHRERTGDLDVTHYRETAERQTGIYDIVDELDADAVSWLAEACCVDSECLKRRAWDDDAGTDLGVPRGDGEFPCREPCSLVIAAAREWAKLERESPRTYEFELTPSEKAQLETIVDAVADGRIDEIREADAGDGANRFRARYLRAKLFEDGELPAHTESADEG